MDSTTPGAYVQLGIGDSFVIYDELGRTYGLQNRFGLCELEDGYVWIDRNNKTMLSMGRDMKISEESIVKGIDSFLEGVSMGSAPSHTPGTDGSIYACFDAYKNIVFFTFWHDNGSIEDNPGQSSMDIRTIGYSNKYKAPMGQFTFYPSMAGSFRKKFYMFNGNDLYRQNASTKQFFGEDFTSYIAFVIRGDHRTLRKFVNMQMLGNEIPFDSYLFEANFNSANNAYGNTMVELHDDRNYKFFVDRWRFSIPMGSGGRFEDSYLLVKFSKASTLNRVKLLNTFTKTIIIP